MSLPKQYLNQASGIEHQRGSNWCTNHAVSSLLEAQFVDQVCQYGMCTEALYPTWEDKDYDERRSCLLRMLCMKKLKSFKPKKRIEIKTTDVESIKRHIVENGGCVAIVKLYKEHTFPIQGCVVKPAKGSEPNGLHAIWICGYIEDMPKTINGVTYKNWFIMQESYGTTRGYKGYLFVSYEAFTEKWTGLYSVDTYIKSVHTFELDSKLIKYPNFHNSNRIDFPCTTIELKVGSKSVQVNKVEQVYGLSCNGRARNNFSAF